MTAFHVPDVAPAFLLSMIEQQHIPISALARDASDASGVRHVEIVIPHCCNMGVVFRTLLAVNGAVLVAILLRTANLQQGLMEFVESSTLMELACLLSLLALCGLRHAVRSIPPWGQRVACALVPAAITGAVIHLLSSLEWLSSFENLTNLKGMAAAALLGALLQHYFELRARAFSPVLVEARLQALQARIRPHFLFNSLNAVLSLIRAEPRRAESTLEDLAELFRVLMRDPRSVASLEEEIRLCRQYLSIEKIRLGERLNVEWKNDVSEDVQRQAQIPVLLLQPLLENAVHHGVEPASGPVKVQISISRTIDRIEIAVTNPWHDVAPTEQGNHMALDNIRERLALLYDVEAQLSTAVSNGLFEVRLRFPYERSAR